jgi:hypothetical protein
MLAPIARAPSALAGRRRAARRPQVLFEFFGAEGTPDIVFLEFDAQELRRRDELDLPPVRNYNEVAVLLALGDGALSAHDLSTRIGVTAAHLRRAILPTLDRQGWVEQADGLWSSPEPLRPLAKWIVAIEAKRRDWRRAMEQAQRYRRFANRAVAVLDASTNLAAARAHAESDGRIGLASIDVDLQKLQAIVLPKWHPPSSPLEFVWAGEQAYLMRRTGVVSGPILPVFGRLLVASDGADPRLVDVPTARSAGSGPEKVLPHA